MHVSNYKITDWLKDIMEMEHFLQYLNETNQLDKINQVNADGTPNMKHKYIRELYNNYLYNKTPSFECPICLEAIENNGCKLKCSHTFCVDCFSNLARTSNKCAMCRQPLSEQKIKKVINQNAIIDIINYELDTPYEERSNLNMYDFTHSIIDNLIKSTNNGTNYVCPDLLSETADSIVREMSDSLHTVAFISADLSDYE